MGRWKLFNTLLQAGLLLCVTVQNVEAFEFNSSNTLKDDVRPASRVNSAELTHSSHLDALIEGALNSMLSSNWVGAEKYAQQLVNTFPDYALGHLVLAEVHLVKASATPLLTSLPSYNQALIDLLLEAQTRARLSNAAAVQTEDANPQLPAELIQTGEHIDHVVMVDLEASELYLFNTNHVQPRLVKKHYISSGKGGYGKLVEGDLKTPLGVYQIQGFRSDESLPALYGSGALMLNYPNVLDRALGRTGSGIWLHGNPRYNRSRSPRSSEGCVTMANDYLLDLHQQIDIARTRVVLTNRVQWIDADTLNIQRERYSELFKQYQKAWLQNDIVDLTALYSPDALPSAIHYANNVTTRKVVAKDTSAEKLSPNGVNLTELETLQPGDISLMINPKLNSDDSKEYLLMEFEVGEVTSSRVTLYWEQNIAGFWQIKRESIQAGGA